MFLLCFWLFNGPLYIPVVSLALLTEGHTAWDLPKQRGAKKNRVERPSVSEVSEQLHVQFGCKLTSKLTYKTN